VIFDRPSRDVAGLAGYVTTWWSLTLTQCNAPAPEIRSRCVVPDQPAELQLRCKTTTKEMQ